MSTNMRFVILTVMLCFAAGAGALAAIDVSPSHSITLLTRTKGMQGDIGRERVEVVATSHGASKLNLTANTCREKQLVDLSGFKTSSSSESGTGHPSELTHTVEFRLTSKQNAGECALTFSDGSQTATVQVRVEKP